MLRIALLFFCLLGLIASEAQAAPASVEAAPVHRRKPTAGNYRPVYKLYRGHSRRRKTFFSRLTNRRTVAQRSVSHSRQGRGRRGTL
ncbi:hypothetical protein [Hymenobacter sp.]|uniref:hypothetical protein n=1 Tax=Hymenobacter sp. TaxID=1898978 RepID=UPI00286CDBB0|nr:hypothetical protein [Hymenobacter sp.]